ncbi:MAG: Lrp/AsnC family transcriptional regulator [Merismopedia sp. SIO2A8]|nr:Lrp/AsnC family transcriptional regulator [Merismopedia sp. SIO2A8]
MASVNQAPDAVSLDAVDQQIITLLHGDGRMAFTEIAKRVGIPEATARYRVQRLLQSDMITIQAWPNPDKLGIPHMIVVWIAASSEYINSVADSLAQMPEVRFVATTAGRYNVVADVNYGVHSELLEFFAKLNKIQGVQSYESEVVLRLIKSEYTYTLN